MLPVGADMVGGGHAHQVVSVLHRIHGVREVVVAVRKTTVPDLAAHKVVLHVALAVAPGEGAVLILAEAHHVAAVVEGIKRIDGIREEIPAIVALRVDDADLRVEVPFKRAAHGIVPDGMGGLAREVLGVVEEVEAVLELRINLDHLRFEHVAMQSRRAAHLVIHGSRVDLVGVGELLRFAVELPGVGNFNRIHVVRIKTEDGNAGMRQKFGASHRILDLLTIRLRNNAHGRFRELIAAVADDGGQRRNAVRVHDINKGI